MHSVYVWNVITQNKSLYPTHNTTYTTENTCNDVHLSIEKNADFNNRQVTF